MTEHFALSIIIPVLNEAANINSMISRLRSQAAVDTVEIIVVDGDPSGSTIRALSHPAVKPVVAGKGRGVQMNRGASLASGDILLFLHADTILPPNACTLIREAFRDRKYSVGCFDLGIDSPQWYFRLTERYAAVRTRITRIPFGDQAIFLRRDFFERLGGYREIPIMEDVDLMRRIRSHNDGLCIIPVKVSTSARRWERDGILYTTFRNLMLQVLYCCGVPPERLARFYQ